MLLSRLKRKKESGSIVIMVRGRGGRRQAAQSVLLCNKPKMENGGVIKYPQDHDSRLPPESEWYGKSKTAEQHRKRKIILYKWNEGYSEWTGLKCSHHELRRVQKRKGTFPSSSSLSKRNATSECNERGKAQLLVFSFPVDAGALNHRANREHRGKPF